MQLLLLATFGSSFLTLFTSFFMDAFFEPPCPRFPSRYLICQNFIITIIILAVAADVNGLMTDPSCLKFFL